MVSVLCLCVHRKKICIVLQGKETNYLMISSQLTGWLTAWSRLHLEKLIVPCLIDRFHVSNSEVHQACSSLPHLRVVSQMSPIHAFHPVS